MPRRFPFRVWRHVLAILSLVTLCGCPADAKKSTASKAPDKAPAPVSQEKTPVKIQLSSTAFDDGSPIPKRHTGEGEDVSPPLAWSGLPEGVEAVADLNWLLSRGYPGTASQKLVGDRYELAARQRTAVARCACSDAQRPCLAGDLVGLLRW